MTIAAHQRPLLHRAAGPADPAWFERRFSANGWSGTWRGGVYARHHFHATTHEVLGCYAGTARLQLGGPAGEVHDIAAGDVVVIPAGLAHCNQGSSADFAVVGAYPGGVSPDLQDGAGDAEVALPRPARDPVLGAGNGFAADAVPVTRG
ncbi:cupin domain-containing protein [Paracoccus sanguinis]|uniref:cupin domain-containing protein n=1 Tax=Paracoccus sanguinis TaxID=1545044 RepID=UPI0014526664|nr:cupin domain-containing protein [Paracoccus sanguinis]QJD15557.1 cupin [Paracoccus sanguinis]